MLYVPTIEIARVTAKYRNALLRYNPRNYLSLTKNEVNQSIKDTVINTTKNEFSLRNNGITILAEYSSVTDRTGVTGEGQLIIKDPQILNGGQTATTLAMLTEDAQVGIAAFASKEVLLKIIERPKGKHSEAELAEFIESISDATNKQSKIVEADRRSNDPRLISLQVYFFKHHGLFLERKRGEFSYGLDEKVLLKTEIVDRVSMLRALTAFAGDPPRARSSQDRIFEEEGFDKLLANIDDSNVVLALFALRAIEQGAQANSSNVPEHAMRYGKYAMLYAVGLLSASVTVDPKQAASEAARLTSAVMSKWEAFEINAKGKSSNSKYNTADGFNFDGYYKGVTVADDIKLYSWR
jgi:hypothetical protein